MNGIERSPAANVAGTAKAAELRNRKRWILWKNVNGAKRPYSMTETGVLRAGGQDDPTRWLSYEDAKAFVDASDGWALGFVLGDGVVGVDLDGCRNPKTGVLDSWASRILDSLPSYTEISPSGTGVKVFLLDRTLDLQPISVKLQRKHHGKNTGIEIYPEGAIRYFAFTGQQLGRETDLAECKRFGQLHELVSKEDVLSRLHLFDFHTEHGRKTDEKIDIRCPWEDEHSEEAHPSGTAVMLTDGAASGFKCFHSKHDGTKSLKDLIAFLGVKAKTSVNRTGFVVGKGGSPLQCVENIELALSKLGFEFRYDTFAMRKRFRADISTFSKSDVVDDAVLVLMRSRINERFGFYPQKELFAEVADVLAYKNSYHPVKDYLATLSWDGVPRIDSWLSTFCKAKDTPLNRAIGAIVLIAAVRRIQQPGAKFDELLVLMSDQGLNKSTAIQKLCPREEWFSDSLPLDADERKVIEATAGKWIIETSELRGLGAKAVEHVKAFLATQVERARLAYGREQVERPREWVPIGTANPGDILNDTTGNRRWWIVEVGEIDIDGLVALRDQLWAEAAAREAKGESIRLDRSLWKDAAEVSETVRLRHPWEDHIADILLSPKPEWLKKTRQNEVYDGKSIRVSTAELFGIVGKSDPGQRRGEDSAVIGRVMRALKFHPTKVWRDGRTVPGWANSTSTGGWEGREA